MTELQNIPISKLEVGQHRQREAGEDEDIDELAASIKRIGVIEPVLVQKEGDTLNLVAGHRRLLAALRVGLQDIPCIVEDSSKARATETAFAENFFRRDPSPVEQAAAIRECIDDKVMTIKELAKGLHKSEKWIYDQAQITTWPDDVLQAIHFKYISVSAARNLAPISDPKYRGFLLATAVENGVTAKQTAAWLQAWQLSRPPEEALAAPKVDGVVPAAAIVPKASCMFCCQMFRTDALNYMGVCGQCLADFQEARARRDTEEKRS